MEVMLYMCVRSMLCGAVSVDVGFVRYRVLVESDDPLDCSGLGRIAI